MEAAADACWVVTDGAAGNEKQALALAVALGHQPRVLRLALRAPWRWLAPLGPSDPRRALDATDAQLLQPPWPALAIGCGRASALLTLGLRRLSGGTTRAVQVLDPRRRRSGYDVLVVPAHDRVTGANVVSCVGSLNLVDDDWLQAGRNAHPQTGALPGPRTAVLVGGPVRGLRMGGDYLNQLEQVLGHWQRRDGGSFLVSCSRRTPAPVAQRLRRFFADHPGCFWAGPDDGANPYAGLLGWADRIVVTPDSANLLSEACATRVPVLAHMPTPLPGRRGRLLRALVESGRLRPLHLAYSAWNSTPVRELPAVARAVAGRLRQR